MLKLKYPICAGLLLLLSISIHAQLPQNRNAGIPVADGGWPLDNPWTGGFNSAQFSPIDLDLNGTVDLFVFDRIGNRIMVFLNSAMPGFPPEYTHNMDYLDAFPEIKNWALMRDMDCDGLPDLVSAASNGMKWFRNTSTPGNPSFELENDLVSASFNFSGEPFDGTLFCLSVDVPSIIDYEGDGDLDVFTWSDAATTIFFFKNMAVENGNCSEPEYTCVNRCYGKLSEASEDFSIFIGDEHECPFNVFEPRTETQIEGDADQEEAGYRHAGGALFQLDLNQDGLLDLVLSDVTDPTMTALIMGECPDGQDSAMVSIDNFPATFTDTDPVHLKVFPTGYYLDVTGDNVKDLLVCPNNTVGTEDNRSVWLYENNGADDLPAFNLTTKGFLQDETLDFGRGAYPVAFDENGDGLMDLIVSNKEYYQGVDQQPSQLALLRNVGSATAPAFDLIDDNYLNLPQYGIESVYPAFGDLDNDGDLDLVLGEETGIMHFFRNNSSDASANFELEIPNIPSAAGGSLDVGQFATPQLWDCNGDALLDLLVGEKNGNINYLENVGTAEVFSFEHLMDTIGDAVASNFLGIGGYSVPHMFENATGDWELVVGSEVGYVNHYSNVEGNFESSFTLVDEQGGGLWEGTYSAVCMYDFDNDDTLDLVLGQRGGGLAWYQGGEVVPNVGEFDAVAFPVHLYPNPGNEELQVLWPVDLGQAHIAIHTLTGQQVLSRTSNAGRALLSTAPLAPGCYLVTITAGQQQVVRRWVRN